MQHIAGAAALQRPRIVRAHPFIVRVTHWINVYAMACMIMSGWAIYNASPLFAFRFPTWTTLGGWLGGAIAWHLALMWLLVGNSLIYVGYGLLSGHFRRCLLPLWPSEIWCDAHAAVRLQLRHEAGRYNAVQRLAYVGVLALGMVEVASGLALWKPVQLAALTMALGGYEVARRVHFAAMTGIVGFVLLHLALIIVVPRTLPDMITGRVRLDADSKGLSE